MRRVVPADKVVDLWVGQTQSDARNAQGNIYFNGDTIYSYGSHFPMGVMRTYQGRPFAIVTNRTYGRTTAKHVIAVRGALSRAGVEYLSVSDIKSLSNPLNREDLEQQLNATLLRASRSRKYRESYEERAENIRKQITLLQGVCHADS